MPHGGLVAQIACQEAFFYEQRASIGTTATQACRTLGPLFHPDASRAVAYCANSRAFRRCGCMQAPHHMQSTSHQTRPPALHLLRQSSDRDKQQEKQGYHRKGRQGDTQVAVTCMLYMSDGCHSNMTGIYSILNLNNSAVIRLTCIFMLLQHEDAHNSLLRGTSQSSLRLPHICCCMLSAGKV